MPGMSLCRKAICLIVLACLLQDTVVDGEGPLEGSVAWFVQISDLHVSKYNKSPILQDLRLVTDQVLAYIRPSKVLLTGDLVDAKTKHGGSQQHASEWEAYREAWQYIATGTDLSAADILDVRGNHDVFDITRTSPTDRFMTHSARAAVSKDSAAARVHVEVVEGLQLPGSSSASKKGGACPAAMLLCVDTTPDVGFRGPTNFMGAVQHDTLAEIDRQLALAMGSLRSRGCVPPVVAYGHHPLGTVHHPNKPPGSGFRGTLRDRLASHDTAAYLNGHLHDVFGDRLHRLHPKHSGALLAELEAADWKQSRRFRVLAADSGAISFADLRFLVAPGASRGTVVPIDTTRVISHHLVLITSPPDATYSPLTAAQLTTRFQTVRCLVLPLGADPSITTPQEGSPRVGTPVASVTLSWRCGGKTGAAQMERVGGEGWVYQARRGSVERVLRCEEAVQLQVVVVDELGKTSKSELRVARMTSQTPEVGEGDPNASFSWMERFMLRTYWPEFGGKLFMTMWSFHLLGMLLLPRALGPHLLSIVTPYRPPAPSPLPPPSTLPASALLALLHHLSSWLLWPPQALARLASMRTAWIGLVLYSINLLTGPWFLASFHAGGPIGALTSYGLYHAPPDPTSPTHPPAPTPFTLDPTPDVHIVTVVHTLTCVIPFTLWLASVVSRWCEPQEPHLNGAPGLLGLSWLQALVALPFLWNHWKVLGRLWSAYGMVAVVASPAIGWVVPLSALLLWHVRRRLAAARGVLMPCRSLPKPD